MTQLMNTVYSLPIRELRMYCALYTRDPDMVNWSRMECIAYVQAWEAVS